MRDIEEVAAIAVDVGFRIHYELGPGLLETVYESILAASLERKGLAVERQKPVSFVFDGCIFKDAFRLDLFVEDSLIIEVKSTESFAKVHGKQLLTYLRITRKPLGLLINFGAPTFKEGVRRIVNDHKNFASSRLRVHNPDAPQPGSPAYWDEFFAKGPCPDFPTLEEIRATDPKLP